jgi:hypothetical protein
MAQGPNNNEASTTPGDDTEHVVEVDKVEANLFFDGTLNNYFNVMKATEEVRKKYGGKESSYANALSNVARMWEPIGKAADGPDIAVYVDGMGTTRFKGDSFAGKAMGQGETGIEQRALQAFGPLVDELKVKRGKLGPPAILSLNVFGFSRGAATARHFVSLLNKKEIRSKYFTQRWEDVILEANFVGLFDTVSSFGYDTNFDDDVQQLHTHFAPQSALRVFHIAALDEYRENFSLTSIASACNATVTCAGKSYPMGFEIAIPGSHSDVGGGYHADVGKPEKEVRNLWSTSKVSNGDGSETTVPGPQAFTYQQGWYQPRDVKKTFLEPVRHERQIAGDYYKVALSLMVDMAEKYTTADYTRVKEVMDAREPGIDRMQSTLRELSKAHAFTSGKPTRVRWDLNTQLGEAKAKIFRRNFLHVSFKDTVGFGPRYKNETDMERKILQG